jgi:hypothetical protein
MLIFTEFNVNPLLPVIFPFIQEVAKVALLTVERLTANWDDLDRDELFLAQPEVIRRIIAKIARGLILFNVFIISFFSY